MKYEPSYLIGVAFVIVLLLAISATCFVLVHIFKEWAKKKITFWKYEIEKYRNFLKVRKDLISRFGKEIKNRYPSILVDSVFQIYLHFYETNYNDFEKWAFPADYFTNGNKNDLMAMYRWIKKVRVDNYNEFKKMLFDFDKACFEFWGSHYQSFTYKFDHDGFLKIFPIEYVEDPSKLFERVRLKLENELYQIDTEKARWILDRRKFFGL